MEINDPAEGEIKVQTAKQLGEEILLHLGLQNRKPALVFLETRPGEVLVRRQPRQDIRKIVGDQSTKNAS